MFLKLLKNKKFTIILVLVILVVVGYGGDKWRENKMNLVNQGLADPKFPYHEYSMLELARQGKMTDTFPESAKDLEKKFLEEWKNLPTRTTPQETFDIYIQALKDGDIERALECIIIREPRIDRNGKPYWEVDEYDKNFLYQVKEKGALDTMVIDLEKIYSMIDWNKVEEATKGKIEIYWTYTYEHCEDGVCNFGFSKDLYGDWKLTGARYY